MQSAPFIRLTVPFIIGICIQDFRPTAELPLACVLWAVAALLCGIIPRNAVVRFRLRPAFGISVFLFFCAAGMFSVQLRQQLEAPLPDGYTRCIARIDDNKGEKGRSIACTATIKQLIAPEQKYRRCEQKIQLYFQPNSSSRALILGDYIIFTPNLSPVSNSSNPESFDYASYARRKGILYSQYLPEQSWRRLGHLPEKNLKAKALQYRNGWINLISGMPLQEESLALLNALLLGNTDMITSHRREAFSEAGLSHILAVSGLHTGIIWWLLAGLFYPLTRLNLSRLRYPFLIAGLWVYAFVTGLSPSVVRACIMATFILTGSLIRRKVNLLNSLFAAAFFMLLYQPYYLFDIGFQLSYLAVLSIALFYPVIARKVMGKSAFRNKIAGILTVSLAAQIGTLPVAAYYFHTVPILFLFTNMLVVPLLPIILGVGILTCTATGLHFHLSWLYHLTDALLHYVISVTEHTSSLPGHVWHVWLEPRHLILYGGILYFLYHAVALRKKRHIVFGWIFALFFLIYDTIVPLKRVSTGWIVYQDNTQTVLHFIDRKNNFLYSPDSVADYESIRKTSSNFRIKNRLPEPVAATDTLLSGNLFIRRPYIFFDHKRILVLDSVSWRNKTSEYHLPLDYVVITSAYKGRIADLQPLFSIKQVIIPANISYFKSYGLERECRQLHIPCHAVRSAGAWVEVR
ncbi:MAG: ComEC/Rec2 family competence protein [Coprobacter sp.]|nr:ComEC/Rec2 family competence protein [Coprobacter sp.]